jgi:hypothetical protein
VSPINVSLNDMSLTVCAPDKAYVEKGLALQSRGCNWLKHWRLVWHLGWHWSELPLLWVGAHTRSSAGEPKKWLDTWMAVEGCRCWGSLFRAVAFMFQGDGCSQATCLVPYVGQMLVLFLCSSDWTAASSALFVTLDLTTSTVCSNCQPFVAALIGPSTSSLEHAARACHTHICAWISVSPHVFMHW